MLWLLGPATAVTAHLDWIELPEGRTDAGFVVTLQHGGGVQSCVESTKLNRISVRELRAYGSRGSYRAYSTDVQAQSIFAGHRPAADPATWGLNPRTAGESSPPTTASSAFPPRRAATRTCTPSSRRQSGAMDRNRSRLPMESAPWRFWTRHGTVTPADAPSKSLAQLSRWSATPPGSINTTAASRSVDFDHAQPVELQGHAARRLYRHRSDHTSWQINWPAFNVSPCWASWLASHATEAAAVSPTAARHFSTSECG